MKAKELLLSGTRKQHEVSLGFYQLAHEDAAAFFLLSGVSCCCFGLWAAEFKYTITAVIAPGTLILWAGGWRTTHPSRAS